MVHKINNVNSDVNELFVDLIERNISNRRQSIIFLTNNQLTLNSRGVSVDLKDDALLVYNDDGALKDIIDVNNIIAVVTK